MGTDCKWCLLGRQVFSNGVERFIAKRRLVFEKSKASLSEYSRAIRLNPRKPKPRRP